MSARMNIFKTEIFLKTKAEENILASVCLTSKHDGIWTQQNINYKIIGINGRQRNFDDCYLNVRQTIENKMNAPVELRQKKIFAFSFYYDRLSSAKLVGEEGGVINVENIRNTAKKGLCK